ncbi:MAG: sigma-70 family RNA polymerase sigma factor [Phycisphaerae bacterium]|nr:sigma-70 family RNA polymerase sigma factor [Phycisphaerae bacterium]
MTKSPPPRRVHASARPRPGSPAEVAIPILVDLHGPKLHALASRLCGNASDADDMVQEVFLQAHRKWHTFKGDADPGTWLYAIAARSCKARTRRKGGIDRRMPALSQVMPWTDHSVADLGASPTSTIGRVIERESARAVHDAIVELPDNFRVPLVLKEMLELPLEEVGKALNLKPETVKTRVHRARLMLRKAILARRALPKKPAPAPTYEMRVCVDLLNAKLDAMDHGRDFPIGQKVVCDRCRAVFAELDLAQNACARLAAGELPRALRDRVIRAMPRA